MITEESINAAANDYVKAAFNFSNGEKFLIYAGFRAGVQWTLRQTQSESLEQKS